MILVFIHVTKDLLHWRIANGSVKIDQFHSCSWNCS